MGHTDGRFIWYNQTHTKSAEFSVWNRRRQEVFLSFIPAMDPKRGFA